MSLPRPQQRKQEEEARKQAVEKRKQDLHPMTVLLADAKADHQLLLNRNLEYSSPSVSGPENRPGAQKKAA